MISCLCTHLETDQEIVPNTKKRIRVCKRLNIYLETKNNSSSTSSILTWDSYLFFFCYSLNRSRKCLWYNAWHFRLTFDMQELNDIGIGYWEFGVEPGKEWNGMEWNGMAILFLHFETNAIGNECSWSHGLIDSVM